MVENILLVLADLALCHWWKIIANLLMLNMQHFVLWQVSNVVVRWSCGILNHV